MLEAVGLTRDQEHLYQLLLERPGVTVAELASAARLSAKALRRLLAGLEIHGLVTYTPDRPVRILPARPDWAVDNLIADRQREFDELRQWSRELVERHHERLSGDDDAHLVELVRGPESIAAMHNQLQLNATDEVLIIDAPPYVYEAPQLNDVELQMLARGVRYRCIYFRPALETDRRFEHLQRYVDAGEEARILDMVHLKLLIVDGQVATIPLSLRSERLEAVLRVTSSSLLDALTICFESLWNQAVPATRQALDKSADPALDPGRRQVLTLLAAGAKDEVIARALGVTTRTVSRRIEKVMKDLGATTRFQAGLQAGRRRWL